MDALKLISQDCLRADKPEVAIGDTVKVYCKIKEGDHYRTQIFEDNQELQTQPEFEKLRSLKEW